MSWIEQQLADLADAGYFDDLPGSGRPIDDLGVEYSPGWWVKRWVERDTAQKEIGGSRAKLSDDIDAALRLAPTEARMRLAAIAAGIAELNRHVDSAQQLPSLDPDQVLIRGTWP